MRLAVLVSSPHANDDSLEPLSASGHDLDALAEALATPMGGWKVERMGAGAGFARELENLLARYFDRDETLLFVSAYARLNDDATPELLLGGQPLALSRLRKLLGTPTGSVAAVLDLVDAAPEADALSATELVAAVRDAIEPKHSGITLLVGVRGPDQAGSASAFATLLGQVLGAHEEGVLEASEAYQQMRGNEERFAEIAAAGGFAGNPQLSLLRDPPRPRSTMPAPPGAESAISEGDLQVAAGRHEEAIKEYKRALFALGSKKSSMRAHVYMKLGDCKRALGRDVEAVTNYDKALSIDPGNRDAFAAAERLLSDQKDHEGLERLWRRELDRATDQKRVAIWKRIALMWLDDAKEPRRGAEALEHWIEASPDDLEALERLAILEETRGRAASSIRTRRRLAEALDDPGHRAQVLAEAARLAADALPIKDEAVELARAALEADPSRVDALQVASGILTEQRKLDELDALFDSTLDRTRDAEVGAALGRQLGQLRLQRLDNPAGARQAFERALVFDPSDTKLREQVADLCEAEGDLAGAIQHLRAALRFAPRSVELYRRALGLFHKLGDEDGAWCAASALDVMGEADINESMTANAHRPEGLVPIQATMTDAEWALLYPERDRELAAVLDAVAPFVIELRLDELAEAGQLPELDPSSLQNPEGTTTLVRGLTWTARVLGIEPPDLYVWDDVPGQLATAPAKSPTAIASRALARGLSLPELAFLWGRHLAYYRPEHYLLSYCHSVRDLGAVLLAALAVGGYDADEPSSLQGRAAALATKLRAAMPEEARDVLAGAVRQLDPSHPRPRLIGWARSVHLAAGRAGLLASGDIHTAAEVLDSFPARADIDSEEHVSDLFAYSLSEHYAELRSRLGIRIS